MPPPYGTDLPPCGADSLDAYLFGCILALAAADSTRPLTAATGLSRAALERLLRRHLPERLALLDAVPADAGSGEDAPEEPDLRQLLREHGVAGAEEEVWLAAIVARRSLEPNHLWQDLGLASRADLNALFRRHFPALVRRNAGDMKWKKFFYRELCRREGMLICKSPNCEVCTDVQACFGQEDGPALLTGLWR